MELATEKYSSGGLAGFEKFVMEYNGEENDFRYLANLCEILNIRNSTGRTRIMFLHEYSSWQEIATESHHMILLRLISKEEQDYLRAKLEEFDFNISRQES